MDEAGHFAVLKLLSRNLWSFRKENYLCDTTIVAGDSEIPAHSVILAAGSSAFRAAFEGLSENDIKYRIEVPHLSSKAVEAALFLIYNGTCSDAADGVDVSEICDQFGIYWTKEGCTIRPDNSASLGDIRWIINGEMSAENLLGVLSGQDESVINVELVEKNNLQDADLMQLQSGTDSANADITDVSLMDVVSGENNDDVKPIMCDVCYKCFSNKSLMEQHSKLHFVVNGSASRPYVCDMCSISFRLNVQLRRHCQLHSQTRRRRFRCKICNKQFHQNYYLKKHLREHETKSSCVNSGVNRKTVSLPSDLKKQLSLAGKENDHMNCQPAGTDIGNQLLLEGEAPQRPLDVDDDPVCPERDEHLVDPDLLHQLLENHAKKRLSSDGTLLGSLCQESKPHVCKECGEAFDYESKLNEHCVLHSKDASYVCYMCNQGFSQRYYLQKHLKRQHENVANYSCELCGKSFRESYMLKKHAQIHAVNRPFACDICGHEFRQEYYLKKHRKRHTDEYNYSCEYCGKAFKENYQLKKHCRIHTTVDRLPCEKCHRSFREEASLRRHLQVHDDGTNYPCEVCGKTFKVRASLNVHRKSHDTEKQWECKVCDMKFTSQRELRRHESAVHTSATPSTHQCCECGKLFAQVTQLKSHIRTHSGERPHKCPHCHRSFRRNADMRSHLLTHTGQKSNLCTVCGKGFLKKSDLKRHFQAHNNERPYVCDTCGKRFKLLNYLKEHLFTHAAEKAFVCPECQKAFISVGNLKNHMKIHSGLKPHKCPLCSKNFLRPANLRSHLKVHFKRSEPFAEPYSPFENLGDLDKYTLSDASQLSSND